MWGHLQPPQSVNGRAWVHINTRQIYCSRHTHNKKAKININKFIKFQKQTSKDFFLLFYANVVKKKKVLFFFFSNYNSTRQKKQIHFVRKKPKYFYF